MPTGIWQVVPVGQVSWFLQRSPQWSGGGLPVEENSHVGMAVAPVAAGHVPPVHFGRQRHMPATLPDMEPGMQPLAGLPYGVALALLSGMAAASAGAKSARRSFIARWKPC